MFLKTKSSKIIAAAASAAIAVGAVTAAVITLNYTPPQVSQKDNTSKDTNSQIVQEDNSETSKKQDITYSPAKDFEYEFTVDGVKINKYIGRDSEVVIPNTIEGKPVVEMGYTTSGMEIYNGPFYGCVGLTSVTIPDSIIKIGNGAFYGCTALTDVNIPDSVTEIGYYSFADCTSLTDIDIPDSVTKIAERAFDGCTALKNINIPDSVTEVGNATFYDTAWYDSQHDGIVYAGKAAYDFKGKMPENTTLFFRDDTTWINQNVLDHNVTDFNIPDSVRYIGSLMKVKDKCLDSLPDGVVYLGKTAVGYKGELPKNTDKIKIKDGTKALCLDAYDLFGMFDVKGIDIPDSVESIDISSLPFDTIINVDSNNKYYSSKDGALFNKDKSVLMYLPISKSDTFTIPAEVKEIERSVLNNSYSRYSVDSNNKYYSSEDGVLFNKDKSVLLRFPTSKTGSYTIPDSVVNITESAFYNSQLTSVTIPDSVKTINRSTFFSCTNLKTVNIPNSVKKISNSAFWDCTSLAEINLPDSVEIIEAGAFNGTEWYNNINESKTDGAVYIGKMFYCYKGDVPANTDFKFEAGTKGIAAGAFSDCTSLTGIIIPDNFTEIPGNAFDGCNSLKSITIPNGVTEIGWLAFQSCTSLTDIYIPESVTRIGKYAFNKCSDATIHGKSGSAAETYSKENNIPFVAE